MDWKKRNPIFMVLFCILIVLSSCVGTVEDKNPKTTKAAETKKETISFAGLTRVTGVAHDKVELYWFPAPGTPENLTYEIYTNNSVVPASIPAVSLNPNVNGELSFTVTGLQINTNYDFAVGVKDAKTGGRSEDNKSMNAKTFANLTADFQGISNVKVPAGSSGKTNLVLEWVPARIDTIALALPYPQDPIAYEVKYINKLFGTSADLNDPNNSDVVIKQFPSSISPTTPATDMRTTNIPGLTPGATYYFQVRAIHKAFVDFGAIPSYKREENTKFFTQTTTSNSGVFSLSSDQLNTNPPKAGADMKDKLELSWFPATGSFNNYRVFWTRVADPDLTEPGPSLVAVDPSILPDQLDDPNITGIIEPAGEKVNGDVDFGYLNVVADDTFALIKSLQAYGHYQFKIAACEDAGCSSRLYSLYASAQILPAMAPFTGVNTVDHPSDPANLDRIQMTMDPPVVTSGYLDKSEVYCYDGNALTDAVLMPNDGSPTNDPGTACDQARMLTTSPTTLAAFTSYDDVQIKLNVPFTGTDVVSTKKYCFAVVPVIDGNFGASDVYDFPALGATTPPRDLSNAIFKCIVPEIRVPTIEDFPGKNLGCNVVGSDINVNWALPTEGIYTNFVVFWKEKDANPFLFSGAVADLGTNAIYQSSIDTNTPTFLNDSATAYTIQNLTPGKRYQYGVLAFINDADPAKRKFSEYNIRTDDCLVPLPKAEFKEIMNIFAVGPKEDGLASYVAGEVPNLLESIDAEGLPVDVALQVDNVTPTTEYIERYGSIGTGALDVFNGSFGAKDGDFGSNPLFKYSNSGVVRFAFKDFELNDGLSLMQHAINNGEIDGTGALLVAKNSIKYGYKIYRSDDGKVTWKDLTTLDNDFQHPNNIGLVTATPLSYYRRNNTGLVNYNGVSFTDYSVIAEKVNPLDNQVARAKVLYYKIIPIFNGGPLEFIDDTLTDHIIKITLPPANMALVDRRVANRTLCEEMGKPILDGFGKPLPYYSCFFNGIGSKGLTAPWTLGTTVYDIGGDLLVDRFEMGCNFTRGNEFNQKSLPLPAEAANTFDFRGMSPSGKFEGCAWDFTTGGAGPSSDPVGDPGPFVSGSSEVRVGDCFARTSTRRYNSTCAPGNSSIRYTFYVPGLIGEPACDSGGPDVTISDYFDVYQDTLDTYANNIQQAEFAAVAYIRQRVTGDDKRTQPHWRAAGDKLLRPGNSGRFPTCHINLSTVAGIDDATDDPKMDGRIKPRWIPLNYLDQLAYDGGASFSILDTTVNDVLTDTRLYDTNAATAATNKNNAPSGILVASSSGRFNGNMKLGRIATSNSAKLPPLGNLSQPLAQKLCEQYEVEVGVGTGVGFNTLENGAKRLPRRKEFVVSAAWPRSRDFLSTSETERGQRTIAADDTGSGLPDDNSSCSSGLKDHGGGQTSADLEVRDHIEAHFPYATGGNGTVTADTLLLSGSSIYDGNSSGGLEPSLNKNTQKCQSKFGIQDMVGNISEHTSDQVFCDFSSDQIKYGTYPGDPDSATIGGGADFKSDGPRSVWVQYLPDSGRCSMVQEGSLRSDVSALAGVSFLPPYFSDGSVNAAVVTKEKDFDKLSVDDARNGDGYFLDFGFDNMGAPIKEHDTMGMVFDSTMMTRAAAGSLGEAGGVDPRRAKYFSPTLGIPLECEGTGCDGSNDNKLFSTEALLCRACTGTMSFNASLDLVVDPSCSCETPGPLGISVADFPVNNSQFTSNGISEKSVSAIYRKREPTPSLITTFSYTDIDTSGSPYTLTAEGPVSTDAAVGPEDPVEVKEVNWTVARNYPMYFLNGGYRDFSLNGRYTASLQGTSPDWQMNNAEFGTRCVIRINESGDY